MPRFLVYLFLLFSSGALASDSAPTFPLWNNQESVAEYAKRVKLPPTQTFDLNNNVKLELVLIPAGKFKMGTPPPTPIDTDAFQRQIMIGRILLLISAGTILMMSVIMLRRAVRRK